MSNAIQNVNKIQAGMCPHGLPAGTCPICAKGGGGSLRVGERPQKAGEMSYHECAMIGAMMKARALSQKNHELNLQHRLKALQNFQQNLNNIAQKMINFANNISKNFILKPVAFTIKNIVVPILQTIQNIPNIINRILDKITNIKDKFIDIQDKLNAIFGEAKAFVEKKVSEIISTLKNKLKQIFIVSNKDNTDDEDKKIDEDKRIFNLKTMIKKILKRNKKDDTKN